MNAVLRVLNVGGGSKAIPIPAHYAGWKQDLLDIDPASGAEIACDARGLRALEPAVYDAVYCSHNLEHYFRHEVPEVLGGFLHVLKPEGFAEVRVPDLKSVIEDAARRALDVEDVLYESPAGPITVNDVLYGFGPEIRRSGRDYYAHKNGFSARSLAAALKHAGFGKVFLKPGPYEVTAIAFRSPPTPEQRAALRLFSNPGSPPQ